MSWFLKISLLFAQLVRLTWWTRQSTAECRDLEDPWATNTSTLTNPMPASSGSELDEDSNKDRLACWKQVGLWLCGLSDPSKPELSTEEKMLLKKKLTSIEEKPIWRNVCNVNALILLTVNVFLWGYFA